MSETRKVPQILSVAMSTYKPTDHEERESTQGWIEYGEGNMYPQYLIDTYHSSPTHSALCNSIAQLVSGKDIYTSDEQANLYIAKWKLHEEFSKASIDFKVHGGYALEIRWSNDRKSLTPKHIPFESIRSGKMDFDDKVRWYWYSADWLLAGSTEFKPVKIRAFDPKEKDEHPVQILYVAPFSVGSVYYPKPDYFGAINYIELDAAIGEFHLNNIRNGLAPSFMIHLKNGIPDIEERNAIRADIERQLSGSKNAGKFLITYSDGDERKPDFEPMPLSDAHNQYQFLSEECTNKIMIGHRVVSPAMFGVKVAGELGNTEELEIASQLFHTQVVAGYQKWLCQTAQDLLAAIGIATPVYISNANPFMPKTDQTSESFSKQEPDFGFILELGEDAPEGYEEVDARAVDYDSDDSLDMFWSFASVLTSTEDEESKQDNPLIKVRYRYAGENTSTKSREFCRKMLSANKVYRKEDILKASKQPVNKGFGVGGDDTYNIWLYKGGARCRHYWQRVTYLRKDNSQLSAAQVRKLLNSLAPNERAKVKPPTNEWQVAVHPNDMDYKGFHPDNPNIPKDAINKRRKTKQNP